MLAMCPVMKTVIILAFISSLGGGRTTARTSSLQVPLFLQFLPKIFTTTYRLFQRLLAVLQPYMSPCPPQACMQVCRCINASMYTLRLQDAALYIPLSTAVDVEEPKIFQHACMHVRHVCRYSDVYAFMYLCTYAIMEGYMHRYRQA